MRTSIPLALTLFSALFAAPLSANPASEDPRWLPWVGCWEPVEGAQGGSDLMVCIRQEGEGARVETLVDGEPLGDVLLVADGRLRTQSEEGCEGDRSVEWSADGRRAFLTSVLDCGGGVLRNTRGVFALGAEGLEWLEIQAVQAGRLDEPPFLSVRRFHGASRATLARHNRETAPGADRGLAIETARRNASRPMGVDDALELFQATGTEVTTALMAELGDPFSLDAATLRRLSRGGAPAEVLDMMIAMTWPERFQVSTDGSVARAAPAERPEDPRSRVGVPSRAAYGAYCTGWLGQCSQADLWFAYRYGSYGAYPYGSYGGWGYSPYGWYAGPRYIVVSPDTQVRQGGSMTPEGYQPSRSSGGSSRPAQPRGDSDGASTSAPRPAPAPSASPAPSAPSTPPTPARPAQPRGTAGGGGGGEGA